jgi:hypothetical protein
MAAIATVMAYDRSTKPIREIITLNISTLLVVNVC